MALVGHHWIKGIPFFAFEPLGGSTLAPFTDLRVLNPLLIGETAPHAGAVAFNMQKGIKAMCWPDLATSVRELQTMTVRTCDVLKLTWFACEDAISFGYLLALWPNQTKKTQQRLRQQEEVCEMLLKKEDVMSTCFMPSLKEASCIK